MVQPLQLPEEKVIFKFLNEDCLTEGIDSNILEIVAKKLSNKPFNEDKSVEALKLKIDSLQLMDLDDALERCAKGKPPIKPQPTYIPKFLANLKKDTNKHESSLDALMKSFESEKELSKKIKDEALQQAKDNKFDDCIKTIQSIENWQTKNETCLFIAEFFAQQGIFDSAHTVVWKMDSPHGSLDELRYRNRAFAKIAVIFAEHGFIKQAEQSLDSISSDYSKYNDSEYASSELERGWSDVVAILINQSKFQEANQLLWHVGKEDRYKLEKQIKKGLGTWQEPQSISSKRYFSSTF